MVARLPHFQLDIPQTLLNVIIRLLKLVKIFTNCIGDCVNSAFSQVERDNQGAFGLQCDGDRVLPGRGNMPARGHGHARRRT